jgi:hypothetical protein
MRNAEWKGRGTWGREKKIRPPRRQGAPRVAKKIEIERVREREK